MDMEWLGRAISVAGITGLIFTLISVPLVLYLGLRGKKPHR